METLLTYHIHLFWHGRVWLHRLRHMGDEMTPLNIFPLIRFLYYHWIQQYPISNVVEFNGEPISCKFVSYFNYFVLQEDNITDNISVDISLPRFY